MRAGSNKIADAGRPGGVLGLGNFDFDADVVLWVLAPLTQGFHGFFELDLVVFRALRQIGDDQVAVDLKAHRAGGLASLLAKLLGMPAQSAVQGGLQCVEVQRSSVFGSGDLLDHPVKVLQRELVQLIHVKLAYFIQHVGFGSHGFSFFQWGLWLLGAICAIRSWVRISGGFRGELERIARYR